jgi:serine/threonine protein kinase
MNCATCHAPLPTDAAFCPNCGTKPSSAGAPAPPASGGVRTYSGLNTVAPMRESSATALEPGTLFAGRYEVVRKLGEGGMGIVYVAKDTNTGEEMVLKLIHPDLVSGEAAVKRLMAEGMMARQIRHPNIVAVYDVALADGQPYFTMEYVKGVSLRSWMVDAIRSGRETTLEIAVNLLKSILAGLAVAHKMGVVHRDLKPENVLLCGDPNAGNFDLKILDFGIARAINAPATARSGGGGGAVGTPLYMAPEQMTSADAVGPPADIYSLTVIFYELLMEAPPQSRWEPVGKNRPGIPKAIDDLIEKGLAARPRSRFAAADQFDRAIDAAMGWQPQRVVPEPKPQPPGGKGLFPLSKRAKIILGVVAAVVVIGVIVSIIDPSWSDTSYLERQRLQQLQDEQQRLQQQQDEQQRLQQQEAERRRQQQIEEERQRKSQPPPPPPPLPPPPPVAGFWLDANGNRFVVQQNGVNFVASGFALPWGNVVITGAFTSPTTTQFTVSTNVGGSTGTGGMYLCGAQALHMRITLNDGSTGDFRINHVQ